MYVICHYKGIFLTSLVTSMNQ